MSQPQFDRRLVKFVVSNLHTLAIVEEEEFREMVTYLNNTVKIISRRQLVRNIENAANIVETALRNELSKVCIQKRS